MAQPPTYLVVVDHDQEGKPDLIKQAFNTQWVIAKIALREAKEKAAAEAKEKAAAEAAEGTQAREPSTEQIQAAVDDQDANPDIDVDD
ncbi:hypothetical protein ONZ45_g13200 [Pleurotus djamor]|nr:hypothetical protein ONZ45_g13200 [Pleurotus djamor]